MVRYGGPRFEYFFTHQFLNKEQDIGKEDAHRVAFILQRREQQRLAEATSVAKKQHEEEERQREEEIKRAAAAVSLTAETRSAARKRRLNELAKPVVRGEEMYRYSTERSLMSGKLAPLRGRAGAPYISGVDRHRIVPPPPPPDAHRPWIGSGVAWMKAEAAEREERRHLFALSKRDAPTVREREQLAVSIERYHTCPVKGKETDAGKKQETPVAAEVPQPPVDCDFISDDGRPPSVFSHTSSNAPIKELGTRHMDTATTKEDVQRHLHQYTTAMELPERKRKLVTPFKDMTLSEVTARLLRMQKKLQR